MHFRVREKAVQLVRTTYDADTKKGVSTVVGSIPRRTMVLPDDMAEKLSDAEKAEFKAFQTSQSEVALLDAKLAAHTFPSTVRKVISYIEETTNEDEKELLRSYIDSTLFDLRRYSKRTKA